MICVDCRLASTVGGGEARRPMLGAVGDASGDTTACTSACAMDASWVKDAANGDKRGEGDS